MHSFLTTCAIDSFGFNVYLIKKKKKNPVNKNVQAQFQKKACVTQFIKVAHPIQKSCILSFKMKAHDMNPPLPSHFINIYEAEQL